MNNDIHNWDIGDKTLNLLNRQEDRSDEEFSNQLKSRNKLEDIKSQQIMVNHNRLCSHTQMSVKPIGDRTGKILENIPKDEGDSLWIFRGQYNFTISVEIKIRDNMGDMFRPRLMDVEKCINYNRPYVLIQNSNTPMERIILIGNSGLSDIIKTQSPIIEEHGKNGAWSPYNNKKKYFILNSKDYQSVSMQDLNPLDTWMNMIAYLNSVGNPLRV